MRAPLALLCALAASAAADEAGAGEHIVKVTKDNFRKEVVEYEGLVLAEYYAPWCGHCKNMAADYDKAAGALKGKPVKLVAIDATEEEELASMFEVSGFPTLVYHPYGKKEDDEGVLYEAFNYGRTADDFMSFAGDELLKSGIDITEITEVTGQDAMDECTGTAKYCAVFILPHVAETGAKGRNEYLDKIKAVGKELGRASPTKFVWMQAGTQEAFEAAFNIGSYPMMTVINAPRTRYAHHIGAFTPAALSKTIRSLQTGRLSASQYKTFPKLVATDKWDGKDYVWPEEEDEY